MKEISIIYCFICLMLLLFGCNKTSVLEEQKTVSNTNYSPVVYQDISDSGSEVTEEEILDSNKNSEETDIVPVNADFLCNSFNTVNVGLDQSLMSKTFYVTGLFDYIMYNALPYDRDYVVIICNDLPYRISCYADNIDEFKFLQSHTMITVSGVIGESYDVPNLFSCKLVK